MVDKASYSVNRGVLHYGLSYIQSHITRGTLRAIPLCTLVYAFHYTQVLIFSSSCHTSVKNITWLTALICKRGGVLGFRYVISPFFLQGMKEGALELLCESDEPGIPKTYGTYLYSK